MNQDDEKKIWAIDQLIQKQKALSRMPRKNDFDEPTRSRIKAFLGPWPRALEAAGLKKVAGQPEASDCRVLEKHERIKKPEQNNFFDPIEEDKTNEKHR